MRPVSEVCPVLNLSIYEVCTPSSGLIQHLLRWTVISLNDRCTKLQWRMVGEDARRYAHTGVIIIVSDSS